MAKWRTIVRLAVAAVLGALLSGPAQAQESVLETRVKDVVAVLQGKRGPADVFDARFLAAVPPEQLQALIAQLSAQGGAVEGYADFHQEQPGAATFTVRFARASAPARIELGATPPGKVSGFRIFGLHPDGDTLGKIDAAFAALPGHAGFAIARLGEGVPVIVQGRSASRPFAIGSTFKLYVLSALARQVREGQRQWSDVVPVSGKSFPGGTVHTLPEGSPVTLHTLASLMISISDNSATDMLVRVVGQEALAREVKLSRHAKPGVMAPMLTTAQLFAIKRQGKDAATRYARAGMAERAEQLAALDLSAVPNARPGEVFGHGPVAIDEVEWFASPTDLAGVMDDLRRLDSPEVFDILAINPAMDGISAREWGYVGYKGGSEDGVISMTWLLRDKAGGWSVVTGSWNDPTHTVDEKRFEILMHRLAKLAAK